MAIRKSVVVVGLALLSASCGKPEAGDTDADPAAKTASAVVEVPTRKAGLWKQTMTLEGMDMIQSVQICIDAASDAKLAWWGQQGLRQACSKNEVSKAPDGSWKFSSICEGGGVKTVSNGVAVGNFEERYQLKAESTTTGAPLAQMNGSRTVTIDAQWVGECPSGMKPGDMKLPDGRTVNMLNISGQQ